MIKQQYKEILEGSLSKHAIGMITDNVDGDPEKFRILASFIMNGEEPLASRAAWAVQKIDEKYPDLITSWISPLIKALPYFIHPGTKRNILKILTRKNIPEKDHGKLTEQCFIWLTDRDIPVAIQVYSMQIIENMSELYPDLILELKEILEARVKNALPGFKARANKILGKNSSIQY